MNLVSITYVGNKEVAFDNVAHSGKSWQGNGDVQFVTPMQAKMLLRHPKAWQLSESKDAAIVSQPIEVEVKDEDGQDVAVDTESLSRPLEKMTKPELVAFAYSRWGKHLDPRKPTKLLIDQIEEWQNSEPELRHRAK
jgi:hypothetical protein